MASSNNEVPITSGTPLREQSGAIEADESLDDKGFAESTSASYIASIATDIRRGIEENGRLYASYGQHKPWVPVDDAEVRSCNGMEASFDR